MLIQKKFIKCLFLSFLLIALIQTNILAVTISKSTLQNNLNMYATQNKQATALTKNGKMLIVGGSDTNISKVVVTNSLITFVTAQNTKITLNYKISGSQIHFYNETTFSTNPKVFFDLEKSPIQQLSLCTLLPVCFLAVTDNYNVDSDVALQYYYDTIYAQQSNNNIEDLLANYMGYQSNTIPTITDLKNFINQCKSLLSKKVSNSIIDYSSDFIISTTSYVQKLDFRINTDYLYLLGFTPEGSNPNPEIPQIPETPSNPESPSTPETPNTPGTTNTPETPSTPGTSSGSDIQPDHEFIDNSISLDNLPATGTYAILFLIIILTFFVVYGLYQKYKLKDV